MGEVGPFVYTVIKARDDVDPDGTALFEWLNENGNKQINLFCAFCKLTRGQVSTNHQVHKEL